MTSKSGFTLVETLIVIIIVGIIISITMIAYSRVQQDARDSTRRGNSTVIAEGLETYYSKNGEYPSVRSLVNNYPDNTGTSVAAKLNISVSALKMPKMPAGATNSLYSAGAPSSDYITYVAKSYSNDTNCQSSPTGGCDEFTMKYAQENGGIITIESRHKGAPSP